jgi:flagellar basal body-associated protein FliL
MKLIIIIVVVLVLVAGGGAATWFFVLGDPSAEAEEEVAPPVDPVFVTLETLSVHVIRGGGVQKYIVLDVTLEVRDLAIKTLAENKMPKLRDVFINALNEYFTNLPSLKGTLNVPHIKKRLLKHSEKALGKDAVIDVLVQGVFERDWEPTN